MPNVFDGGGDLVVRESFGIDSAVGARICLGSLSQQIGNPLLGGIIAEKRTQSAVAALSRGEPFVNRLRGCRQMDDDPAVSHNSAVEFANGNAAAGGDDTAGFIGQFTEDVGLDLAEHILAVLFEDLGYGLSGAVFDEVVHVDEGESEQFSGPDSAERLSGAGEADEVDVAVRFHCSN